MEIVMNEKQFGVQLTYEEMRSYCKRLGLTLRVHEAYHEAEKIRPGSDKTWFVGVDWLEFRSNPVLIEDVRSGALPDNEHRALRVVQVPDDMSLWEFDTDWWKYERIKPLLDWSNTTAVWDGEDWVFDNVPLEACPKWRGHTCFSRMELGYNGHDPKTAVYALRYWVENGESGEEPFEGSTQPYGPDVQSFVEE